jgi:HAD superfamily hydrolase (TIGR01549 family)
MKYIIDEIFWDLDGTIDRRRVGCKPISKYVELWYYSIKNHLKDSETICKMPKNPLDMTRRLAAEYFTDVVTGIEKCLYGLEMIGKNHSIATNASKATAETFLEKNDIKKYFKEILTSNDVELKPNPQCLEVLLKRRGAKRENCLFVTDSFSDVKMAKKAGVKPIRVGWGIDGPTPIGNEVVVNDCNELYEKIKSM